MCFVVFCGVLRVFCDVLRVFCDVLRVFCSISTKYTKHPKTSENTEKHENSQYARVLRAFIKSQKFRLYCTKHYFTKHLQNTAKLRKTPQNGHKTRFVKLRRKTLQNKRKTLKTVRKRSQYSRNTYCAHSVLF